MFTHQFFDLLLRLDDHWQVSKVEADHKTEDIIKKIKYIGESIEGKTEEYKAMQRIVFENTTIEANNNLLFHCNEDVFLLPNTIIEQGSEVIIDAGNLCNGKGSSQSKYEIYNNEENILSYNRIQDSLTRTINYSYLSTFENLNIYEKKDVVVFPNPNNGEFYINTTFPITMSMIQLNNIQGKTIPFTLIQNRIVLDIQFSGILFIKINTSTNINMFKVFIQ